MRYLYRSVAGLPVALVGVLVEGEKPTLWVGPTMNLALVGTTNHLKANTTVYKTLI